MKIAVCGSGYVGLVVGVCLADLGNEVICVDIDADKIKKLNEGIVPIYEPGLSDQIVRNVREKRLTFTTDAALAVKKSDVIFIAVGTPSGEDGRADLKYVKAVAKTIGENINGYKVIIDKSTVPVGTGNIVENIIKENMKEQHLFDVVSNPEFLREGEAIGDFTYPDRIVVGTDSEKARKVMEELYKGIARTDRPILFTDILSAEMIKYASNAMLATRISFMNEVARLCEKVGGDVKMVAKGMGLDRRIGPRFLQAGLGYGGSCFPKDVKALISTGEDNGMEFKILRAVEDVNKEQKIHAVAKLQKFLPDLHGKTIAIWGLAFKPKTDDMREAPSIAIINKLQSLGANIKAFDPEAEETAKQIFSNIEYASTPMEAAKEADALIIVTEWNEFRNLDRKQLKSLLKQPIVIDGRNVYEPEEMGQLGFKYMGVGR